MTLYSNCKPNDYDITKDDLGVITVDLNKNIRQIEDYFVCESTSLVIENQENLEDYIKTNFDNLYKQGIENEKEALEEKESK